MIEVKNLTKRYGNHLAVDHLNFTVESGKIYGFLGPNGAGKSTTMNIMTGYLGATEGQVLIDGHDILKEPEEAKKNIGYLPEIPPLYMEMTVREYLEFAAELKGIKKDKREPQIEEVIRLAKLRDVENRLIQNLSKGYKQRVGFAQALLGNPKFLILDEPTVGLDPKQVSEVREIIRELKKEHSVIFSSHILSEVSAICDRVVIINKGEIKAIDTIENLENKFSNNLVLNLTVTGNKESVSQIMSGIKGVDKIIETAPVSDNICNYRVALNGNADEIRSLIMSELIAHKYSISEIFTEKPNLEDVFVQLINQPSKKESLRDMLEEMKQEEENPHDEDSEEKEDK